MEIRDNRDKSFRLPVIEGNIAHITCCGIYIYITLETGYTITLDKSELKKINLEIQE